MGFFDWLMKGIGFESDEDEVKEKKKKKKKQKRTEIELEPEEDEQQPEIAQSFEPDGYNAFGNVDANSFSSNEKFGEFAPENGVSGFGTKNVVIHRPKTYKEVQGIIDFLKQGEAAIMILDSLTNSEAQRILDFVSGSVYALSGSVQRVDGNIFLLTPEGYNIVS